MFVSFGGFLWNFVDGVGVSVFVGEGLGFLYFWVGLVIVVFSYVLRV